jgi:hypothetical protein
MEKNFLNRRRDGKRGFSNGHKAGEGGGSAPIVDAGFAAFSICIKFI